MAKTRYVVGCLRHGVESKDWAGKQVVVGISKSKKDRNSSGCPFCATEAAAARKEEAARKGQLQPA